MGMFFILFYFDYITTNYFLESRSSMSHNHHNDDLTMTQQVVDDTTTSELVTDGTMTSERVTDDTTDSSEHVV